MDNVIQCNACKRCILKVHAYIQNLRPITLLNIDYKIVEKMLANRLKPALSHIINEDQKGFMENRHISCNIRRVMDLISLADEEEMPVIITSIDFEKCFDRIEHVALFAAMEYFKIHEDFQKWTRIIYNGSIASVINNGHMSRFLQIERGVQRGGHVPHIIFF